MTVHVPGTPQLLRAINDQAALRALLEHGPLTRPELGDLIGLSKPTAHQLLTRLRDSGLVVREGRRGGGPGPTAEEYGINPSAAHVCGLDITPGRIEAVVAGLTGQTVGRFRLPSPSRAGGKAASEVSTAVAGACAAAGIDVTGLSRVVVGVQGVVEPETGRLGYSRHLPGWGIPDLADRLRAALGTRVEIENDVNLAALAEAQHGVARGHSDFVVLWAGSGLGMALVLGGRLHRGAGGGAGEIGFMPVPGAPTARETGRFAPHGLQALSAGPAVRTVLRSHGFRGTDAAAAMRAAAARESEPSGRDALRDVAVRLATGLASVTALLDPALVVLTGDVLMAGGEALRRHVEHELHRLTIPRPPLRLSTVGPDPVLTGAVEHGLTLTRDELFASTVPP
ncbi:ROK family transcriptional regulator [Actinocorallia sp. A-T 12471]|uniref:ROK family transcriptional regulator n=1 Tax=Actinocorallia sp. A-T 12471 TaxID=3089813 RepID=UPI0029D38AD6|nr:ROK family transcriptional regulator [Actinocorallia sp. A-T 12471]MDX6741203.1 ROK family transcriptional regulator [Actinocorallia sp. A-T 12471]